MALMKLCKFFVLLFCIAGAEVVFQQAEVVGESFVRPEARPEVHRQLDVCGGAQQVHITLGDADGTMVVSYITTATVATSTSVVYYSRNLATVTTDLQAIGTTETYSQQMYVSKSLLQPAMGSPTETIQNIISIVNTSAWAKDPVTGQKFANYLYVKATTLTALGTAIGGPNSGFNGFLAYKNPKAIYESPYIHTVTLTGLLPKTLYYYKPLGACHVFNFTMPFYYTTATAVASTSTNPSPFPFMMALTADLGITQVSNVNVKAVKALNPAVALTVGDLCYADGYPKIWDTFGQMVEGTFAYIPYLTVGGNHENGAGENWKNYDARFPAPYRRSGSTTNHYWAREVGPVFLVGLSSYHATGPASPQYVWLDNVLSTKLNRQRTPWLIVMFHTPWYNSNTGHWKESELMRQDMETMLYNAGVDLVLAGHIHAYERTQPIYNEAVDPCGPVYMTVGDGGNYEGPYTPWRTAGLDPWVGFREASFGIAGLNILNSTHAKYDWHRTACGSSSSTEYYMNFSSSCFTPTDNSVYKMATSDSAMLIRPSQAACPKRYFGSAANDAFNPTVAPTPQPSKKPSSSRLRKLDEIEATAAAAAVVTEEKPVEELVLPKEIAVEFSEADVKGEDYVRPKGLNAIHPIAFASMPCGDIQQVHILPGNYDGEMIVSWVTTNATASPSSVVYYSTAQATVMTDMYASGTVDTVSEEYYIAYDLMSPAMGEPLVSIMDIIKIVNTSSWAKDPVTGQKYAQYKNVPAATLAALAKAVGGTSKNGGFEYYLDYKNPQAIYESPYIHTVTLTGLQSKTKYYYKPEGACQVFSFTMPFYYSKPTYASAATANPSPFPFTLGLTADLGQTAVTVANLAALRAISPDVILTVGDLCYADGYHKLWDTFGRMMQSTIAYVPYLTVGGNHENGDGENWKNYDMRYPTPYIGAGSTTPHYYYKEVGPVFLLALSSYHATGSTSPQYVWLQWVLANKVNRQRTPWLIVMFHTPWYNSNTGHWKESELMRQDMETMLYNAGVDLVLGGHIHAYERTQPIYNEAVDPCGPVYITIGDGGNYEGPYTPWRTAGLDPWVSFREASFGIAGLKIFNSTHAKYDWHRVACASSSSAANYMNFSSTCFTPADNSVSKMATSDSTWFVRPSQAACPNRVFTAYPTAAPTTVPTAFPVALLSESSCFAGSEVVEKVSGESVLISEVKVGDKVLAYSPSKGFVYSEVVAVPHPKNDESAKFMEISTEDSMKIRLTNEHLILTNDCEVDEFNLIPAKKVLVNQCVKTVKGKSQVKSVQSVAGKGVYTVVTHEEFVVVSGVVASPFAVSHSLGNWFYNGYRAVYYMAPTLVKSAYFQASFAAFADLVMSVS